MPYSHRYHTRSKRKSAVKLQRWIRRKRSSRAQAGQLIKTNRRINKIRQELKRDQNKTGLYLATGSDNFSDTILMLQPATTMGSVSPAWTPCFADSTISAAATRAKFGRCRVKMQFTCGNERSPITYTVMHVRLNPKNAVWMNEVYGNDLNAISAPQQFVRGQSSSGQGYASASGNVILNPDYFIVKKQWRFTLSAFQAIAQSTQLDSNYAPATYKNIDYSFPLGYTIGKSLGNWTTASADADTAPHLKNYLMIFTDNSTADLQSNSVRILAQTFAYGQT